MKYMLYRFSYNTLLLLAGVFYLPKMLYDKLVLGKYTDSFPQRFGVDFPDMKKNDRYTIWVHAVSVGETKAVSNLVRRLKKNFNNPLIIISSTTETGHAEAKKCLGCADHHVYLPFDLSWIINPIIRRISPNLVIVTETDFWYNFLKASKDAGAITALVNGKLSKRSTKRFSFFKTFSKELFEQFDVLCLQSEHHVPRFMKVGVPKSKIKVTGNLKLDDDYPDINEEELLAWKREIGIEEQDKVVVIGSTHSPEETLFIEIFQKLWKDYPEIKLVIVPRHPERFEEVAKMLTSLNIPFTRFSTSRKKQGGEKVVLIDAMGLLRKCYQFADISVVGGSFIDTVGGHNIVEPCWYGSPTLFGPYMESQPELVKLVKIFKAGIQLPLDKVSDTIVDLLYKDPAKRDRLGEAGVLLAANSKGATKKTCDLLKAIPLLKKHL
jgi:3-deoxy-D-manno-octulosonic-acid transferase